MPGRAQLGLIPTSVDTRERPAAVAAPAAAVPSKVLGKSKQPHVQSVGVPVHLLKHL